MEAIAVTVRLATWRFPDPVALVKLTPVLETKLAARFVPVALVNVMPVEETVVPISVVTVRFVPVALVNVMPVEEILPAK